MGIGRQLCLEALLDVQYSKATAGNIPLTVISDAQYSLAGWAQQIAGLTDPAPIQSVSYGNDEIQQTSAAYMDSVNVQFQKLGAMGVSVLFASGDQGVVGRSGKTSDGKYHPDFPAASPFITAVGGTDLATKSVIGGTSAACPVASGLFARLNAARSEKGMPNMGFLNPWIYQNPQAWNDVKEGSAYQTSAVQAY